MRWILAPLLVLSCFVGSEAAARSANPEIWFDARNPVDWLDVFDDAAPWPNAAKHVGVMMMEPAWLRGASDADLLAKGDYIRRHHMKGEVDIEAISYTPADTCVNGEGYQPLVEIIPMMQNLKRLNFPVDWIHIDEPVWFGHYAQVCQFPVPELVKRVAAMVNGILAVYPDIHIVEIEPISSVMVLPDWRETLTSFRVGLAIQTGRKISGIMTDVDWDSPNWQQLMIELNTYLREQNLELSIIYNGSAADVGDAAWIEHAVNNMEAVEGYLGILPDEAIFATWNAYPTHDLPETTPTTMTWLIDRYALQRSRLDAEFVGQGARGKLTTVEGKPIANATIQGRVPGVDFTRPLPVKTIQDVVPANAVQALLAFRLNIECSCSGSDDVLIGTLRYQEIQGGTVSQTASFPSTPQVINGVIVDGERVGGSLVTRIIASSTQTFSPNLALFSVTPGATFRFSVPAATIGGEGWYGNVFIIWVDQNGNGISREYVVPDPGYRVTSTAVTNSDGTFALPNLPRVGPGSVPVSVYFDGGGTRRSATWTPLH